MSFFHRADIRRLLSHASLMTIRFTGVTIGKYGIGIIHLEKRP